MWAWGVQDKDWGSISKIAFFSLHVPCHFLLWNAFLKRRILRKYATQENEILSPYSAVYCVTEILASSISVCIGFAKTCREEWTHALLLPDHGILISWTDIRITTWQTFWTMYFPALHIFRNAPVQKAFHIEKCPCKQKNEIFEMDPPSLFPAGSFAHIIARRIFVRVLCGRQF